MSRKHGFGLLLLVCLTGGLVACAQGAADVDSDPTVEIEIFWPIRAWVCHGVTLANAREANRIDCFDDPFLIQREPTSSEKPERMFPRADEAATIYKLLYFMSKSHLKIDHTL